MNSTIRFSPTTTQLRNAKLVIKSDTLNDFVIFLTGQGSSLATSTTTTTITPTTTTVPATTTTVQYVSEYSTMNVRGSFNSWGTNPMTLVADNLWEATETISAGALLYKFDFDGSWATNWGDNSNDGIAGSEEANINYTVANTGAVTFRFNDLTLEYSVSEASTATTTTTTTTLNASTTTTTIIQNYSIIFNKNDAGATGTMTNQILAAGSSANLKTCSFTKTGYNFAGWATSSTGSVVYTNQALYTIGNSDVTLYAKWTGNVYTVTFDKQGGTGGSNSVNVTYGSPMPAATAPTKTGGTFNGYWDAISGGIQYYSSSMTNMWNWDKTINSTLYARWLVPEIEVRQSSTIIVDGGNYNFTNSTKLSEYRDVVFTILNLGDSGSSINLTGIPKVALSGTDVTMFTVQTQPVSPVTTSASFTIRFTPTSTGSKNVTVSIANSDIDENPYIFTINAVSTEWYGIKAVDSTGSVGYDLDIITSVGVNTIYAAYYDYTNSYIKFAKTTDGGMTWTTRNVDTTKNSADLSAQIRIAASSETNVYISYYDSVNKNLKVARSTNSGDTWTTVTVDNGASNTGYENSITVSGSNVLVSYVEYLSSSPYANLKFAKSIDGGVNWTTSTIDSGIHTGYGNSITCSGVWVYISYGCRYNVNPSLKFVKSSNTGTSWSTIQTITSVAPAVTKLVKNNSNLYIYFDNATTGGQYLIRSNDDGITWFTGSIASISNSGYNWGKSIAVSGSNLYLTYVAGTASDDLWFHKSIDGGVTWPSENKKSVETTGDVGKYSSIGVMGTSIVILYYDQTNLDLKFAKSIDGGATW